MLPLHTPLTSLHRDQLFSSVVAIMLQTAHFQTPVEMLDTLRVRMQDRLARHGAFHTQLLTAVRDYSRWLQPLGVTLYNGFATRGGIEAAHSYTYKPRALVPECSDAGDRWDVFCVVKAYMRDVGNNQPPLLVLPVSAPAAVQGPLPTEVVPLRPFSPDRIETMLALAATLDQPEFDLQRAAGALRALVYSNVYELMLLPWLATPRQLQVAEAEAQQGPPVFPHLPQTTWPLMLRKGSRMPRRAEEVPAPRV